MSTIYVVLCNPFANLMSLHCAVFFDIYRLHLSAVSIGSDKTTTTELNLSPALYQSLYSADLTPQDFTRLAHSFGIRGRIFRREHLICPDQCFYHRAPYYADATGIPDYGFPRRDSWGGDIGHRQALLASTAARPHRVDHHAGIDSPRHFPSAARPHSAHRASAAGHAQFSREQYLLVRQRLLA